MEAEAIKRQFCHSLKCDRCGAKDVAYRPSTKIRPVRHHADDPWSKACDGMLRPISFREVPV